MAFTYITILLILGSTMAVEFQIKNNLPRSILVGTQGNTGKKPLIGGGFRLNAGQQRTITSADNWAGRIWARTWCNQNLCETGDCGNRLQCGGNGGAPPASLIEITLRGSGGKDFYDVSLVDGFNVVCSIQPVGGRGDCRKAACPIDINKKCPNDLKLIGSSGHVIGCRSSCNKYNQDRDCCRNAHGAPQTCRPSTSAKVFKQHCPLAYSYAYDDPTSTFTCRASKYIITFG